ncbi:MAG TPA: UbiX family flavin prenyltransferase [Terriglobales bacterium]|nr:UbiX family flavin prenyltransferase [Terriglobales bacterium]
MKLTLAITGASGAALARAVLERLERDERVGHVDLVASPHGLRVTREELHLPEGKLDEFPARLLGRPAPKVQMHDDRNIGANIASGSYPSAGMLVVPCSMGTLAGIAHGMADSLIERAADVCLKERRRLLLAVRESPLNRVHLRNLLAADEAGATIFPVMPAFYDRALTAEAMTAQFAARLLEHLGLPQPDVFQWQG